MPSVTVHLTDREIAALDREARRGGTSRHAVARAALRRGMSTAGLDMPQTKTSSEKQTLNRIAHLERRFRAADPDDRHQAFVALVAALEQHWREATTDRSRTRRWRRLDDVYADYLAEAHDHDYLDALGRWFAITKPDLSDVQVERAAEAAWQRERRRRAKPRQTKSSTSTSDDHTQIASV